MTQNERILARLNAGLLCSFEPLGWFPPIIRVAARVNDLKADGHTITTVPCQHGDGTRHVAYILETAAQRSLFS